MKKIVIIIMFSLGLMSCCTNKQIIATTASNENISIELPPSSKSASLDAIARKGSPFADMSPKIKQYWKVYDNGNFNIFTMWKEKGTYKDVYNEKGATETAYQGSENLLRSEIVNVNGLKFYINASNSSRLFRIKASTYFDYADFAVVIECKEKDLPEAQKKLMEIIKSLKVE